MDNELRNTQEEQLLKYISENGEIVYALNDRKPIGDGFYMNPGRRYMGIANRPTRLTCGSCTMAGMCQFCVNKYLFQPIERKLKDGEQE